MMQAETFSTKSSVPLPDVFSSNLTDIFTIAQPSIVQVHTEGRGAGTGIIWNAQGHIITNNHVVARDNARVQVYLADGRTLDARVLHRNPRLDLALLKTTSDIPKPLAIGDSSALRIGEWVFAIGHPWGQRWILTAGIVSAVRTAKLAEDVTTQYIQSDVLLAPGNSGGPLLNADGSAVGINAMIFGGDLSVSIPSNVVTNWLASLTRRTTKLGIAVQTVELPETARTLLNLQRQQGLLIAGVEDTRQADDLMVGDILLDVAGKPVTTPAELRQIVAQLDTPEKVSLTLIRAGAVMNLDVATIINDSIL
jgi:serine protease Do